MRNIELAVPFMNDGRFDTLLEEVEHYNSGVQDHTNLDNRLQQQKSDAPVRINLNNQEKDDFMAFMLTFTDEKISDSFINP